MTFSQIVLMSLMLCIVFPAPTQAAVFWDDDFEGASGTTIPNWVYDFDNTGGLGSWTLLQADTAQARTGTHGIHAHFPDPVNPGGDGPVISRGFPASSHFFARAAIRVASGMQVGSNGFTKCLRWAPDNDVPNFLIELHGSGTSFTYIITVEGSADIGGGEILDTNTAPTRNAWDDVEVEVLMNTSGSANGLVRVWVNNVLKLEVLNRRWANVSNNTYSRLQIIEQSGLGDVYYDRVAMGSTRIGPVGSGDTTPPNAPAGLSVK